MGVLIDPKFWASVEARYAALLGCRTANKTNTMHRRYSTDPSDSKPHPCAPDLDTRLWNRLVHRAHVKANKGQEGLDWVEAQIATEGPNAVVARATARKFCNAVEDSQGAIPPFKRSSTADRRQIMNVSNIRGVIEPFIVDTRAVYNTLAGEQREGRRARFFTRHLQQEFGKEETPGDALRRTLEKELTGKYAGGTAWSCQRAVRRFVCHLVENVRRTQIKRGAADDHLAIRDFKMKDQYGLRASFDLRSTLARDGKTTSTRLYRSGSRGLWVRQTRTPATALDIGLHYSAVASQVRASIAGNAFFFVIRQGLRYKPLREAFGNEDILMVTQPLTLVRDELDHLGFRLPIAVKQREKFLGSNAGGGAAGIDPGGRFGAAVVTIDSDRARFLLSNSDRHIKAYYRRSDERRRRRYVASARLRRKDEDRERREYARLCRRRDDVQRRVRGAQPPPPPHARAWTRTGTPLLQLATYLVEIPNVQCAKVFLGVPRQSSNTQPIAQIPLRRPSQTQRDYEKPYAALRRQANFEVAGDLRVPTNADGARSPVPRRTRESYQRVGHDPLVRPVRQTERRRLELCLHLRDVWTGRPSRSDWCAKQPLQGRLRLRSCPARMTGAAARSVPRSKPPQLAHPS